MDSSDFVQELERILMDSDTPGDSPVTDLRAPSGCAAAGNKHLEVIVDVIEQVTAHCLDQLPPDSKSVVQEWGLSDLTVSLRGFLWTHAGIAWCQEHAQSRYQGMGPGRGSSKHRCSFTVCNVASAMYMKLLTGRLFSPVPETTAGPSSGGEVATRHEGSSAFGGAFCCGRSTDDGDHSDDDNIDADALFQDDWSDCTFQMVDSTHDDIFDFSALWTGPDAVLESVGRMWAVSNPFARGDEADKRVPGVPLGNLCPACVCGCSGSGRGPQPARQPSSVSLSV